VTASSHKGEAPVTAIETNGGEYEAGESAAEVLTIMELQYSGSNLHHPDANQGGRNRTELAYRVLEPAHPKMPLHGPPIKGLPFAGTKKPLARCCAPIPLERQFQAAEWQRRHDFARPLALMQVQIGWGC
jgi:hypothetical protein